MKTKLKKIRTAYGITEYKLQNGLRVLYKKDQAAPIVGVCVVFHVGSRNEAPGHTGSTHILEHLLFEDTKNFNKENGKAITGFLELMGAFVNASTWFDRTNYYEIVPKEKLTDALALEADRMRNSLFSEQDLKEEMTIVRNEYEISRNNPFELLDEEVMATAYTVHPYRIPTIGNKEDIENASAKKLHEFYDQFYWPNNATLLVIGDATWREVEKSVMHCFAPLSTSPHPIPAMKLVEPKQKKARTVSIKKPLGLTIASLTYKIPPATHRDFAALYVAAMILGGGYASRLQKALVDTGRAADISVNVPMLHDLGVLTATAHVAEGATSESVLKIMRHEIGLCNKSGVQDDELLRAKERILSQISRERDGVLTQIRALTESVAAGDWRLAYSLENAIKKIKPADITAVTRKYLIKEGETAGMLHDA